MYERPNDHWGGYDHLLVFPRSDGNPDTVYTAVKTMTGSFDEGRFAADFGEIFHYCSECGFGYGLQAVRLGGWDGQVYGELRFPPPITSNEEFPERREANRLAVWPNPTRSSISLQLKLSQAGQVHVSVFDLLGREVLVWEGMVASYEETIELDLRTLPTGSYIARLTTENEASRGVLFTLVE